MLSYAGKVTDTKCTEHLIPEFPDLLFGKQSDGKSMFFDVSAYLESKGLSSSLADDFLKSYEKPIADLILQLQLPEAKVCSLNTEGHVLIDGSLVYLFISFVEPRFLLYMFDRMDELFTTGVSVSDTYLAQNTLRRIPLEVLKQAKDAASNQ